MLAICHSGCQWLNHALIVRGRHASGVGGPLVLSKSTVRKVRPTQLIQTPHQTDTNAPRSDHVLDRRSSGGGGSRHRPFGCGTRGHTSHPTHGSQTQGSQTCDVNPTRRYRSTAVLSRKCNGCWLLAIRIDIEYLRARNLARLLYLAQLWVACPR